MRAHADEQMDLQIDACMEWQTDRCMHERADRQTYLIKHLSNEDFIFY